jgi:hypothetical protein
VEFSSQEVTRMRRGLYVPENRQLLAEECDLALKDAPRGALRCPNPACGEPILFVPVSVQRRAHFKHVIGVADLESCYYFAEETPTQRQHDCIDLLEEELLRRYGREMVEPEAWVDGLNAPLDLLVVWPDGRRWGFWYVSPRRTTMTPNLLKQAEAAGVRLTVFTHVEARKPADLFDDPARPSFVLDPGTGTLWHGGVRAPIDLWQWEDDGTLVLKAPPAPPPPPTTFVPRPAAGGGPVQPSFLMDPVDGDSEAGPGAGSLPDPATAVGIHRSEAGVTLPEGLPVHAKGRQIWADLGEARLPEELHWMIQAPPDEWAPRVLHWFLSRRQPFRISHACQYAAERWRLHPSLSGRYDPAFLRAMHAFWEQVEQEGLVSIGGQPLMVHPLAK